MLRRQRAQRIGDPDRLDSFTYTTGCDRGPMLLVAGEVSCNRVWHLPTASPPITARQLGKLSAASLGGASKTRRMPRMLLRIAGFFDRTNRDLEEVLHQYTHDYVFDSSEFESRFSLAPTQYGQGIRETTAHQQHSREYIQPC